MKKIIFAILIVLPSIILLESFGVAGLGKKDGTEPGYTGSPGDTLKNCTACHGGTAVDVEDWIASDIPSSGYVPGETYTITATNTEIGATRFGFEVSPQAIDGTLLGTMVITDTLRTKLVGNGKYVTYRADGVEGVNELSWSFDWIAPQAGTGEVVFYGAFNSNFEGHKAGDHTYLSTLKVHESGTTGLAGVQDRIGLSVYPNPATNVVHIDLGARSSSDFTVTLFDLSGKQVIAPLTGKQQGAANLEINTRELPAGNYVLRLQAGRETLNRQIRIQR